MMIKQARSAGFCFGVNRAVELVYKLLGEGKSVCTLGPIIHNPNVVGDLADRGVKIVESPEEVPSGSTLVIRSHGVAREVTERCKSAGVSFIDATCPYVAKIHKIVAAAPKGSVVIIAGDKDHPEIQGIRGHCEVPSYVFRNDDELKKISENHPELSNKQITVVSQTTFNTAEWKKCLSTVKKVYTNAIIFDTICKATEERQREAAELSSECDTMIIVGGRQSSNTAKLVEVCRRNCPRTYLVENAAEIPREVIETAQCVGITAGASTPAGIIKEVKDIMSEEKIVTTGEVEKNQADEQAEVETKKSFDEMTFEEALEESLKNLNNTDQKVRGTVISVGKTEIQVDIGRKQTGYVALSELTADPTKEASDIVSVGDQLDLIIMRTNDQDGTVMLSKRLVDARKGWDEVVAASEDNSVLEGTVVDIIKGGMLAVTDAGVRVFIPASQASLNRMDSLEPLRHQRVKFRIIEVDQRRRRAVGSVRVVAREERRAAEDALWQTLAVGNTYTGTVKSLTSYGAFVDIGGADGMVHISELSWQRIKHPSEVVSVGDVIEVYVKDLDTEARRISLGYKKPEDNPWEIFKANYAVGSVVKVKIVSTTTFGAFARIIPGVDGLIHISQLSDKHVAKVTDVVSVGDEVEVKITDIDYDRKRISLSMSALIDSSDDSADGNADEAETVEAADEVTEE